MKISERVRAPRPRKKDDCFLEKKWCIIKANCRPRSSSILVCVMTVPVLLVAYKVIFDFHANRLGSASENIMYGRDRYSTTEKPGQPNHRFNVAEIPETLEADLDNEEPKFPVVPDAAPKDHAKSLGDDDSNYALNDLWHGRNVPDVVSPDPHSFTIYAVLSHCLGDLSWLKGYIAGYSFRSFTIVSKCGVQPRAEHLPSGAKIIQMDNIGRIDHTIAHWMAHVLPSTRFNSTKKDNEIVLFLKDNINVHAEAILRNLTTVLSLASVEGFGCALEPRRGKSFFHITDVLTTFFMEDYTRVVRGVNSPNMDSHDVRFKSEYKNMGAWLRDLGILLPQPLVPVCYGGNFAVKIANAQQVPHQIWSNMELSLSRGDNIEEGHFAERTWAGLLYRALSVSEKDLLFGRMQNVEHLHGFMRGALKKSN